MQLGETLQIPRAQPDRHPIVPEQVQDAAITIVLATASIAFAPLLHGISPLLAIAVLTLMSCAIIVAAPSYAPAIAIFVLLFQNLFVSMLSSVIADPSALDFIKG